MQVLVAAAWPPWPLTDGARLLLHHQMRHLASRHDITLLAAARNPGEDEPPAGAEVAGLATEVVGDPGTRLGRYVRGRLAGWRMREPFEVPLVLGSELRERFREHLATGPDLVHLFGWGTAPLARDAEGFRVVHTAIDAWSLGHRMRSAPWWRDLIEADQRFFVPRHERRHYPAVDAVVVVSERDADHLRSLVPGARIEVVPNGVDPGPAPRDADDGVTIGFHGVLSSRANVAAARHLVQEVLPLVRQRHPSARALLVGHAPTPEVTSLAADDVDVVADVDEIRPWLERMTVYVAPMHIGSGIKNKVLEAMAAGRPIVATPRAIAGIGAGRGISEGVDARALAAATADLLDDPARRARVGAVARVRVVEEFSWERSAVRIEALWQELST